MKLVNSLKKWGKSMQCIASLIFSAMIAVNFNAYAAEKTKDNKDNTEEKSVDQNKSEEFKKALKIKVTTKFENVELEKIASFFEKELEKKYPGKKYKIIFIGTKGAKVTIEMTNESIEDQIKALCEISNLEIEIKGNVLKIK